LIKAADRDHGTAASTGSKLFIRENGATEGTLGLPELDREAVKKARELMVHGRNEYVTTDSGAQYFVEAYTTPPQLVLCGGGHVSKAISPLAKTLGFRVFITDDRVDFANPDRFPEADMLVAEKPEDAIPQLPINPNTFIIIATRGHRYDNVALEAAARTPAKYVGLLGSRRKTILIYQRLVQLGIPPERLRAVQAPIGLDIGALTPEELAVSIMSEIIMFRHGGSGGPMRMDEKYFNRAIETALSAEAASV
jgi:xanthine dehydrogenase accessory factor